MNDVRLFRKVSQTMWCMRCVYYHWNVSRTAVKVRWIELSTHEPMINVLTPYRIRYQICSAFDKTYISHDHCIQSHITSISMESSTVTACIIRKSSRPRKIKKNQVFFYNHVFVHFWQIGEKKTFRWKTLWKFFIRKCPFPPYNRLEHRAQR